ncbi:hypothetical protein CH294_09470 [Rhodococcus sp. 14-2483-1-1]|uniref:cupredoxin domain-containing protein n=1 Tax=Rhodococcus sp. 14-2483-1-1 TaxID=2023148 RepID=UPI000B9C5A77|nr:cupredoxin domain-containing protein [Rhodococcus sp. 14-2483-1-1]OZF37767.1 hypothetical protein CH294_09470 [Rhodococcus sp. 14-2483-1-1]
MFAKNAAVITLAGAGLLLAGCGSGASPESAAPAPSMSMSMSMPVSTSEVSVGSADIVISGFAFQVPTRVSPGQQITIRNGDSTEHSVTADTGDTFDVDVGGGETATLTAPTAPGTYAFHCEYHPNMMAVLTVG